MGRQEAIMRNRLKEIYHSSVRNQLKGECVKKFPRSLLVAHPMFDWSGEEVLDRDTVSSYKEST